MSRLIGVLLLCFIGLANVWSQSSIVAILDADDDTPILAAKIQITSLCDGDVVRSWTDSKGETKIDLGTPCQKGYAVLIMSISYEKYEDTLLSLPKHIKLRPTDSDLNQLVVTGQYGASTTNNSVHKVKVIDAERIKAQGAVSLRDVMTNEVNMRLTQDGVLGSFISMQGIGGDNIKILIDGVPVIGRLDGSIDLSQINLNTVERIEIVEGPMAVSYGTNALGGTINIITKKGSKNKLNAGINTLYESVGQYNADVDINAKIKSHAISISGGRNYFDGWTAGDPIEIIPKAKLADSARAKSWNPKEQYFFTLAYKNRFKGFTVSPYFRMFDEFILNRGLPRAPYYESAFDDHYKTNRSDAGLSLDGLIGKKHVLNVVGGHNRYTRTKNSFVTDLTTLESNLSPVEGDQDTSKFSLWMTRGTISTMDDSSRFNYQLGYDISYEDAYGERIADGTKSLGDYALFGSVQYKAFNNALLIKPGVRAAYNTSYNAPVIPSIHIKQTIKNWQVRGSYAKGFRAPSLKELYFLFVDINHNIIGNDELLAEKSDNYQLSFNYLGKSDSSKINLDVGVYYNRIFDKITLALTGVNQEYTYLNISEYISQGVNANFNYRGEKLFGTVGFALNGIYNSLSQDYSVDKFAYSPEVRTNLSYMLPKHIKLSAFYKYTGRLLSFTIDQNDNVLTGRLADFHTLDLSVSKSFFDNSLNVVIGGKNLFNVTNINSDVMVSGGAHSGGSTSRLTAWGTTFFINLKYSFNK